jgi:hypothetical protein
LRVSFGATEIIYPPALISALWSEIPTDRELTKALFEPLAAWLGNAVPGDTLVLQGEFSATFALADFAFQKGLIPVCSVTKRIAREVREGEKVYRNYVFEHIVFRRYCYYKDLA